MLTSKGMAGVARASLVVAATLPMFHLPEAGLLLILGIDQFFDMGRTATNVIGNSIATAVVAKYEKEDDKSSRRRRFPPIRRASGRRERRLRLHPFRSGRRRSARWSRGAIAPADAVAVIKRPAVFRARLSLQVRSERRYGCVADVDPLRHRCLAQQRGHHGLQR